MLSLGVGRKGDVPFFLFSFLFSSLLGLKMTTIGIL